MKRIVLEGCNGDWSQKQYLPVLAKEAARGNIELWAVDIGDKIKLDSPQLEKDWQVAQRKNRAHYLNKDTQAYKKLSNVDYVFIVAPDQFHSEITIFWLERLAPEGKIFIEKPLDASLTVAEMLKKHMEAKDVKESVFGFDHYLARAYLFLKDATSHLTKIGRVEKVEVHLLECPPISKQREKTLDKGMIFDLFCHGLTLVGAAVNQNSTCSSAKLQTIKLEKVKAAQYAGCLISGETFALIKFMVNNDIEVVSAIGKCVGVSDDKFMKIYGSEGQMEIDFSTKEDSFSIIDSHGERKESWRHKPIHVENFLEELLSGTKHPLSLPGVLSFDAALEILSILDRAKRRIGNKMPEYQCNDSIDKILEILGERKIQ